jgi:hypothetical protein
MVAGLLMGEILTIQLVKFHHPPADPGNRDNPITLRLTHHPHQYRGYRGYRGYQGYGGVWD